MNYNKIIKLISFFVFLTLFLSSCGGFKKTDSRNTPVNALERAKKNVDEGRGISIRGALGRGGETTFQFSSSNPMWRASLEILDFIPMSTVDYSGGMIISDWYTGDSRNADE